MPSLPPATKKENGAVEPQPFLKWVGGKSQLIAQFDGFFPSKIERYHEPFLGGGAIFFHLKHRWPGMKASLCDNNAELINAYEVVRDHPAALMTQLDQHLAGFLADRSAYYYAVRSRHNAAVSSSIARAARLIFLNKTCFNGLWRVNSRGEFNVPMGAYKNPRLYDRDNLLAASRALQGVKLAVQDFRKTVVETKRGDFAYIDPPYVPLSATASFTSYTKDNFGPVEQRELACHVVAAAKRGVTLMLSNSDTPLVRELYRDLTIHTVRARRAINSNAAKRGSINEVLIVNRS